MKKTRVALLVLLVIAIAVVAGGYRATQKRNRRLAPAKPAPIPAELDSIANNWSWSQTSKNRAVVEARAQDFRQIKDSSRFELGQVELKIFSKTGETYDLVRSRQAEFDQSAERLYSEGDVTIVLGLPAAAPRAPGRRYVEIRTSGLTYENKAGVARTERPVYFQFENGEGRSTGAVYDSARRYLWMKSDVDVTGVPSLYGSESGPQDLPSAALHIRAGELHYYEAEQKVELMPWSWIERGGQGVKAGVAVIYLEEGALKRVDAQQGQGWNISPDREVRFGGDQLAVSFTPQQTVAGASGTGHVQVVSRSPTGITTATGGRMFLEFVSPPEAAESELSVASVQEKARVENVPAASPPSASNQSRPQTRILTSEVIRLSMMPGGREVRSVETLAPGRLDFLPSQAGQWKRTLTADRLSLQYLPGNRPETLRAAGRVHVESEPPAEPLAGKVRISPPSPRLTWSDDLQGFFDPQSGQMRELRQGSNFRFEEGPRRAQAGGARFDLLNDRIYLDTAVRVWDESSLTTADSMTLDQKADRLLAEGKVTSTHREKPAAAQQGAAQEALFPSDRPMQATAHHLDSEKHNRLLHYSGGARLWQEGNSVQAEQIDLDREAKTLAARVGVITVLADQEETGTAPKPPGAKGAG
ncbi:MAG: LPS export ABC transporter periplasmic protein LptC, partial [Acidobacteria bacterium]|nr:LPS export ABC transporter periplasmic protein LptC [Acidobacteriota bacterium]